MKFAIPIIAIALFLSLAIPGSALPEAYRPERPDLTVEKLDVSKKYPTSGETVTVTLWIKNAGTNTSPSFSYELISGDSKFQERVISTNRKYNVLETGTLFKTNLEATVFGPTTLKVVVDRENTVRELDDSNNEKSINVGFEETPALPPEVEQPQPVVQPLIPNTQLPPNINIPFQQKEAEKFAASVGNTLLIIVVAIVAIIVVVILVVVFLVMRKKPSAPSAAPPQAPLKKEMPRAPKK